MSARRIEIIAVRGLPEVRRGDDLAALTVTAASAQGDDLAEGDVLAVAQKVVSKAEGRTVSLGDVVPSPRAERLAAAGGRDPRVIELALRESRAVVAHDPDRGILITETRTGLVCANSGVDSSNVPGADTALLLPEDPDRSAAHLAAYARRLAGVRSLGVVICDTFGRPWRMGQTNVAIGAFGVRALVDHRGRADAFGRELRVTEIASADEIAGAAELVMGKTDGVPVAIVRGLPAWMVGPPDDPGGAGRLVRDRESDLFR